MPSQLQQPPAKRRKDSHSSPSEAPPEFWDKLSRVPLCRRALREFDRRAIPTIPPQSRALGEFDRREIPTIPPQSRALGEFDDGRAIRTIPAQSYALREFDDRRAIPPLPRQSPEIREFDDRRAIPPLPRQSSELREFDDRRAIPPLPRQSPKLREFDDRRAIPPLPRQRPKLREFDDRRAIPPLPRQSPELREFDDRRAIPPIPPQKQCAKRDVQHSQVKQLQRFARRGGPDLRSIRGYPDQATQAKMAPKRPLSNRSSAFSSNTKPTTVSSKDGAFELKLIDNGLYPPGYTAVVPDNLEEIEERIQQRRASPSPSRDDFLDFNRKDNDAKSEAAVMNKVFSIITGKDNILSGYDQLFNNLEPLGDHISNPKPDYFNGVHPADIRCKVRDDLEHYIIPSSQQDRAALPNFFAEVKGPDGKVLDAELQITQDLAAGARGMLLIQSYGLDEPKYDGKAYTFGVTYCSGLMRLYAMHPTKPRNADGKPEYHTTKLNGYDLTGNLGQHCKGIAAFRNLRDLAEERRFEFMTSANETADDDNEPEAASVDTSLTSSISTSQSMPSELCTADSHHEESDSTSEDELAGPVPSKKRKKAYEVGLRKKRKGNIGDSLVDQDDE
ncbi:hypothetical protein EG328_005703 [Venturia inaequalis]|uniref:DUF7924 domain-containing protein n=1 Tax=Venturia inaequalis TaxID=5025 RepID=A0A8H3UL27_VENIN|nr:hypothetical protein EG328_005703 [Venturia inaequalis]